MSWIWTDETSKDLRTQDIGVQLDLIISYSHFQVELSVDAHQSSDLVGGIARLLLLVGREKWR